jgi:hypothetical protein
MSPFFRSLHVAGILTACILFFGLQPARGFSILEPKETTAYHSGETITAYLSLGEVPGITKVKYYWYGEYEDMLEELAEERLALVATAKSMPPFGGAIQIPLKAMGTYRLLAVGEQGGRQSEVASLAIFDEVMVQIEPKAALEEIDVQMDKPLRFGRAGSARVYDQVDFMGKRVDLPVIGRFSDGITRSIRSHTAGTTYQSGDESIMTVTEDGVLHLVGNGRTFLTIKNRDKEASIEVRVEVNEDPNQPPVADPGKQQVVYSGDRVTLNGLGSYDPEGGSLQYYWSQIRGSKVPLLDPYSAQAKFLAPFVVAERTFRFKLRVTDTQGADSRPAFVDIIVQP